MKTKILILDKDINEFQNLISDELFPGEKIQFIFSNDSLEAISFMGGNDIDIVISGLHVPKVNGIDFLAFVQNHFPKTFRIALTSSNDKEKCIQLIKVVHRFLKKPLIKEELLKTIKDFSSLRNFNLDAQLISTINGLCTVPTLPDIYVKLDREMNRPSISLNHVAEIISEDPLLVARIFHIAHSSFFNIPSGITDLLQSINFLGVNIIKALVLYVKIFTLKNVSSETEIILKKIRIHSINVAKLTKAIIEKESKDREEIERAYITGLLHDVGKIVLLQLNEKQRSTCYINKIQNFDSPDFERNIFGVSHIEVGTYILGLWKFPTEIIEAIAYHHDTSLIKDNVISLKQSVFIANLFSNKFDDIAIRLAKTYGIEKLNEWNQLMEGDERLDLNPSEN